jgi:hypothetical protein
MSIFIKEAIGHPNEASFQVSNNPPQLLLKRDTVAIQSNVIEPYCRLLLHKGSQQDLLHFHLLNDFTLMILTQVHLRKPCYDFYFL